MTSGTSADRTLTRLSAWMSAAAFTGFVALAHLPPRGSLPPSAPSAGSEHGGEQQSRHAAATVSVQDQALPTPLRRAETPAAPLPDAPPADVPEQEKTPDSRPAPQTENAGSAQTAPVAAGAQAVVASATDSSASAKGQEQAAAGNASNSPPRALMPIVKAAPPPDEWTPEQLATELRNCLQVLAPAAAEIELAEPLKKGACGTPAPLTLRRLGGSRGVEFSPPPTMNCRLAASLNEWVEKVLQPSAEKVLGARIKRIIGASYSCRNVYNNPKLTLSEHATGNAIDIAAFVTADGRMVKVVNAWGPTRRDIAAAQKKAEAKEAEARKAEGKKSADRKAVAGTGAGSPKVKVPPLSAAEHGTQASAQKSPANLQKTDYRQAAAQTADKAAEGKTDASAAAGKNAGGKPSDGKPAPLKPATTKEAMFLRRLHDDSCGLFTTVLGPEANEAHRDHFHLDIKIRRSKTPICR